MAGFILRKDPRKFNTNKVSKMLRKISNLGMDFDGMAFKNSKAIGLYDKDLNTENNANTFQYQESVYDIFSGYSLTDPSMRKNISLYDTQYNDNKRNELRRLATQDEIEEILDIITDDIICYNKNGLFCELLYNETLLSDEVNKYIKESFNMIYNIWGFWDQNIAWGFARKFLIDGYIAFEIIYDGDNTNSGNQKNIIKFKELDVLSLIPAVEKETGEKIWIQYPNDNTKQRVLYDSQVIYISYSQFDSACRTSYVERLSRSFNLLRIMEATRIIWAVTNSQYKTTFTIPVENHNSRGKQALAETMHSYKEIIDFNNESGELNINGSPMMPFNKEYWLPSVNGESPRIEVLGGQGPEIADDAMLTYFKNKLFSASKIPFSRFDNLQGRGSYAINADNILREEIKYSKFIERLRSIFKELIIKPVYIQLCLKYKDFSTDIKFKNSLTLNFVSDNVFIEMRELELISKRIEFINSVNQSLVTKNNDGDETPYFDIDFLINRYSGFTKEDIDANKKVKYEKSLIDEGYKPEDIQKILKGEDKSKFKPIKKKEDKEEDKEDESNNFL